MDEDTPTCVRCGEDFPVSEESHWEMGKLRKITKSMRHFWDLFGRFRDKEMGEPYLCGNCYFDLTD